jgi:hypothetical protein
MIMRAGNQQAAIIGAKIKRRIDGTAVFAGRI